MSFNDWLKKNNAETTSEDTDDQQGEQKRPETQLEETKTRFKPIDAVSRNMLTSTQSLPKLPPVKKSSRKSSPYKER